MTHDNTPPVSLPQAQETPKDNIVKLARYILQLDRTAREWQRQCEQNESSLNKLRTDLAAERLGHEELKKEMAAVEQAAHMPSDYQSGMPSWINQELYMCYIGADVSPHIAKRHARLVEQWDVACAELRKSREYATSLERQLGETQAILSGVEAQIDRVRQAWTRLCDCTDEFEPEDMSACSEYRDMLDSALLALLTPGGGGA